MMKLPSITAIYGFMFVLLANRETALASQDDPYFPSTNFCDRSPDSTHACGARAWIFPEMHINFVCKHDFRSTEDQGKHYWVPGSEDIDSTWGDFLDYVARLIPEVGAAYTGKDSLVNTGLFWAQGGEGRPGWDIPPCGTNRSQGVANIANMVIVLAETTTADEQDLYNWGVSVDQVAFYINEDSVRAGVEQYLCAAEDLERLYVGVANGKGASFDEDDYNYFYPEPEEICPRVEDSSVWEDWLGYVLLALVLFLALALLAGCCLFKHRRAAAIVGSPPELAANAARTEKDSDDAVDRQADV